MKKELIRSLFKGHRRDTSFLIKIKPESFGEVSTSILLEAAKNDIPVIYVTAKKPSVYVRKELEAEDVDLESLYFVDMITRTITDEDLPEEERVIYLKGPQNLTNVGTSISLAEDSLDSETIFIVFDSLEALLTYNSREEVIRLLDDLRDRTRTLLLNLVLFKQSDRLDEEIGADLYKIVDEVVVIDEGTASVEVVEEDQEYKKVKIPVDIARALKWKLGDELDFSVKEDYRLELKKK